MERSPILITGCPRSGKTMIAQILQIAGVSFGKTDKMMLNPDIDQLVRGLMQMNDGSSDMYIPQNWNAKVSAVFDQQAGNARNLGIKHSGIANTWPVWKYAFPDAKVVIVRRRIGDIVSSCMKTKYMTQCSTQQEWLELMRDYEEKFAQMVLSEMNCKVVWPHRMAYGDYGQIYELLEWLGLSWKSEILTFIDPKFEKQRKRK